MAREPEQVVLLHGYTSTARIWDEVAEDLRRDHEVLAVTLLGHRGGTHPATGETPTIDSFADALEEDLAVAGFKEPHIVGNSLGGWLAIEMAARQRAKSVLALCPAGFWVGPNDPDGERVRGLFSRSHAQALRARRLAPLALRVPSVRRRAFRRVAVHGDRLSRTAALEAMHGVLECTAASDGLEEGARRYDDLACPVAIRLGECDRYFPPTRYEPQIAERVPGAEITVLPGVGHLPMIDEPRLIAQEVRAWVSQAIPFTEA